MAPQPHTQERRTLRVFLVTSRSSTSLQSLRGQKTNRRGRCRRPRRARARGHALAGPRFRHLGVPAEPAARNEPDGSKRRLRRGNHTLKRRTRAGLHSHRRRKTRRLHRLRRRARAAPRRAGRSRRWRRGGDCEHYLVGRAASGSRSTPAGAGPGASTSSTGAAVASAGSRRADGQLGRRAATSSLRPASMPADWRARSWSFAEDAARRRPSPPEVAPRASTIRPGRATGAASRGRCAVAARRGCLSPKGRACDA